MHFVAFLNAVYKKRWLWFVSSSVVFNCKTVKQSSQSCKKNPQKVQLQLFLFSQDVCCFSKAPLSFCQQLGWLPFSPIIPNRPLLHPSVWNHGCVTPLVRKNDSSSALKVSTPIPTWQELAAALWLPAAGDWLWLGARQSEQQTCRFTRQVSCWFSWGSVWLELKRATNND